MPFASADAVDKALTSGRCHSWDFTRIGTLIPEATGQWVTCHPEAGSPGAGAVAGGAWAGLDNDGIFFPDVSPQERWLVGVEAQATQRGTLLIVDRLGHRSITITTTGAKTVGASLPTRYASANSDDLANIQPWVEVTTQTATSAPQVRVSSYTDEGGTSGVDAGVALTFPATATNVGWMGRLPLLAGDRAVSAINEINVVVAPSAGVINVVLLRVLARIPVHDNVPTILTHRNGLRRTRVYDDSSIGMLFKPATSGVATTIEGSITCAYTG